MKTKKISKKLNFQKLTISNLGDILGGEDKTGVASVCPCVYTYTKCRTECPTAALPNECQLCF